MRAQSLLIASLVTLVSFMPSASLVSPALAEEAEDDPMTILWECVDSDTLGECVNCCLDEFLDDPGIFYVCVEQCSDQCVADLYDPNFDRSLDVCEMPLFETKPEGDSSKDPIADCLDSDSLGECVNCCLDEFLKEPGLFYVCVEQCSDQCESDLDYGWSEIIEDEPGPCDPADDERKKDEDDDLIINCVSSER